MSTVYLKILSTLVIHVLGHPAPENIHPSRPTREWRNGGYVQICTVVYNVHALPYKSLFLKY